MLYYKINKSKGKFSYGDFEVYTKTQKSDYYINYHFVFTEEESKPELEFNGGTNDGANQRTYRIIGADLVEKTANGFKEKMQLLQQGELEFAYLESGAGDFVGGFHGDEVMDSAELCADGKTIDLFNECELQSCNELVFLLTAKMFRCNSDSRQVNNHVLKYTIKSDCEIELDQSVEWLVNNLKIDKAMLCMLTIYRCDVQNNRVTDILKYHKWDNDICDIIDTGDFDADSNLIKNCSYSGQGYVIAYGKNSGIFAKAGYKSIAGIKGEFNNYCWVRPFGDNKTYFSANNGATVKCGDFWHWINYYKLDYLF